MDPQQPLIGAEHSTMAFVYLWWASAPRLVAATADAAVPEHCST